MLQREVFPKYRQYVKELNEVYSYLQSLYNDSYVDELCAMRGYVDDNQRNLIKEMNLGYCEIEDLSFLEKFSPELGLITEKDKHFILNGRFIIPVYSVNGDLVSLIGYYNDFKKYITLSTPFFSKECMFFNFKQAYELSWEKYDGFVILVEGIFDCLSLRSIGLPAIATMGATVSDVKGDLLRVFSKVLGIPDDDKTGRAALNRYSKKGWKVPSNTTMLAFKGGLFEVGGQYLHCKDMDNLVSWYEPESVREFLLSFKDCKEDIVTYKF